MSSRAHIVATIGPSSEAPDVLCKMIAGGMDIARLNFAWLDAASGAQKIDAIRAAAGACGRGIPPIIADLPGPRVQQEHGHTYDATVATLLTPEDEAKIKMCAEKKVEYIALSFVGSAADIAAGRATIAKYEGSQKIIAKIERKVAVEKIDEILAAADAVMVARGDLGAEVPLEQIPFIQKDIVAKANAAGKPVIVATQMLLSMTEHDAPTRAEVTDVEEAIMQGADAVMLSEETANGKHPLEAVTMMEKILLETERHEDKQLHLL
jgi:pyruvate kinase